MSDIPYIDPKTDPFSALVSKVLEAVLIDGVLKPTLDSMAREMTPAPTPVRLPLRRRVAVQWARIRHTTTPTHPT